MEGMIKMKYMDALEDLKNLISSTITQKNTNKNFYEQIINNINEKIRTGKVTGLFNDNIKIEFFTKNELFWLIKAIHEFIKEYDYEKELDYKPEKFFTDGEINKITTTPIELDEEIVQMEFPFTLPTVDGDQWTCCRMPIVTLAKYYQAAILNYDKRIQRETKKVKLKGEGFSERIKTYEKNVKEIKEAYIKNTFTPTEISLNILKGETDMDIEPYEYDKETLTFKIPVTDKVIVQIVDGFHRLKAMAEAVEEDPKLKDLDESKQRVTKVNILYRDLTKAGGYIIQQSKGNKISPAKLKTLDTSDVTTSIASDLNSEGDENTNFLFENIGLENEDVLKLNKYTTIDILSKAIQRHWDIDVKDLKQKRILKEYLIDFFNEIISIYPQQFKNIKESRKDFVIVQGVIFGAFVSLAKKLEKVKRWETKLDNILENTDWKLEENGTWQGINVTNLNLPVRQIKKLDSVFENLYKEEAES